MITAKYVWDFFYIFTAGQGNKVENYPFTCNRITSPRHVALPQMTAAKKA
jgi:hypothetical protein